MVLFYGIECLGVKPGMRGQRSVRGRESRAEEITGRIFDPQNYRIALENVVAIRLFQHAPQANHWVPKYTEACDITAIRAKPEGVPLTDGKSCY